MEQCELEPTAIAPIELSVESQVSVARTIISQNPNHSTRELSALLRCSTYVIERAKRELAGQRKSAEQKEAVRKAAQERNRASWKSLGWCTPCKENGNHVPVSVARALRPQTRHYDVTAALCGDPLPGQSALDKRAEMAKLEAPVVNPLLRIHDYREVEIRRYG